PDSLQTRLVEVPGYETTWDENGYMTSGVISHAIGFGLLASSRGDRTESTIDDASIQIEYMPNDRWSVVLDYQHLNTTYDRENNTLTNKSVNSDVYLDLRPDIPVIEYLGTHSYGSYASWQGCGDPSVDPPIDISVDSLADPGHQCASYMASIMDTNVDAEGTMDSFTADVEFQIEGDWLRSVAAGMYFSDIDRTTQDDAYVN